MTVIITGGTIKHTPWEEYDGIKNLQAKKAYKKWIKANATQDVFYKAIVRLFAESID